MSDELIRDSFDSGTPFEASGGYSRAVRIGDRILVSGTAAVGPDGLVGGQDPAAQANFIIDKIEDAIQRMGGALRDVVRTRTYVKNRGDVDAVARVHGARFADIRPANTLVLVQLADEAFLVEIEVEAVIGAGDALKPPSTR